MTSPEQSPMPQPEIDSVAEMLRKSFSKRGITTSLYRDSDDCLRLVLEAPETPPQTLAKTVHQGFVRLQLLID